MVICYVLVGRFFEVLIGARAEPLWQLLSKVAVLYTLEPIFTVIFVVNMNTIWEKVMSSLRAQIFGSVLIQKVITSWCIHSHFKLIRVVSMLIWYVYIQHFL